VPISIESVSPEGAFKVVSHVFTFAIDAFEGMRTGYALGSFESGGFDLGLALQHHASSL